MDELQRKLNKIDILEERIHHWMETTVDYRKELCAKIEDIKCSIHTIQDKFEKLPCDSRGAEHLGMLKSMQGQIAWLWILISGVVVAVVVAVLKHLLTI